MRRLILALLFLLIGGSALHAQDNRSVVAERWDVAITRVDAVANRFHVTEQQDLAFTGTFRAGTRTLNLTNLERYANIRVSVDGQQLTTGCDEQPGHVCVTDQGGSLRVRYLFPMPATDETVQVKIEYDVDGALRVYEGGDQLQWQAIPEDHDYPIRRSSVTVQLPAAYAPRAGVDPVTASAGTVNVDAGLITVTNDQTLPPNVSFSVRVQFPHHPAARLPDWQAAETQRATFRTEQLPLINLLGLALAALFGLGLPLLFVVKLVTNARTRIIVPEYLTEPPDDLPPALVSALLDNRAIGARPVLATLFDLAQRGYLQMEQLADDHLFRQLKPTTGEMLRPFEHQILRSVFASVDARTVSSLKDSFYAVMGTVTKSIKADLAGAGLVDERARGRRGLTSFISILLMLTGFGLLVYWRDDLAAWLGAIFGGLPASDFSGLVIILGIVLIVDGLSARLLLARSNERTVKGAEAAAKWSAFKRYLENAPNLEAKLGVNIENFSRYLPYTIAFGLDQSWISRFSREPDVSAPTWYVPYVPYPYSFDSPSALPFDFDNDGPLTSGGALPNVGASLDSLSQGLSNSLESISTGLSDMLNSAAAALDSRPAPVTSSSDSTSSWSSGSDSSWSSGGDSWSGGGDSGGGDSGGGGSSFD